MEEELGTPAARRSSTRAKKVGAKVSAVLADPNVRAQAIEQTYGGAAKLCTSLLLDRLWTLALGGILVSIEWNSSIACVQAALARLDALESDHIAVETIDVDGDDDASLDDEDQGFREKKAAKGTKRKTRRAKAQAMERIGNNKKAPRSFLDLLQEANLESLPAHLPTYYKASVGPPSSGARRHFCTVCGYLAPYTCTCCGARFCSCRCKVVHNDTRCQKFLQ